MRFKAGIGHADSFVHAIAIFYFVVGTKAYIVPFLQKNEVITYPHSLDFYELARNVHQSPKARSNLETQGTVCRENVARQSYDTRIVQHE